MERVSIYKNKIEDSVVKYFTYENYGVVADGVFDVTESLQKAINSVVEEYGYGILYIPEGKYLISKTIYIPKAVRVIGYGGSRPVFVLKDNAPNFNVKLENDKGGYRYLFWFVDKIVEDESQVADANPGTFYSAMSNVDVMLGEGNDNAVAFRTHYAQHAFLSYIHIDVMSGMAGIYDVGNEMEHISISGGKYAIITTKCSPGWPFMMVDTYFENQKIAAIKTHEAGLTIVRNHTVNVPKFIDVDEYYFEKLYIEDSVYDNISEILLDIAMDNNSLTQINLKNVSCNNVKNLAHYKDSGRCVELKNNGMVDYTHGTVIDDLNIDRKIVDELSVISKSDTDDLLQTDLRRLPEVEEWTNVVSHGLIGDSVTDNSERIRNLIDKYRVLYFPQGEYLFSDSIKLKKDTVLIGMHPFSTRLILKDNSENFTGIGAVKGFVITPKDGENIINGLGIETGGMNPRAAALLWQAGANSYGNDIKLIGGHGTLVKGTGEFLMPYNESRTADSIKERAWDAQYPSFLVKQGGGVFKDIWSASPYATSGFEVQDSEVDSKVYCMSLEHHQRNELRLINTKNWKFYAFQTEEEVAEGEYALPIELVNSEDIRFCTAYFFRTIFVKTPFECCVKAYSSKNIEFYNVHNNSQMKYTITTFLKNYSNGNEIRLWQAARAVVTTESVNNAIDSNCGKGTVDKFEGVQVFLDEADIKSEEVSIFKAYKGFRFADGGIKDSKGNFYFVDSLDKRAYKIDAVTGSLSVVMESPIKINSIAIDTEDNLIFIGEYVIPAGATLDGVPQVNELPEDSYGTSYGYWYNKDAVTFAFTYSSGEIVPLEKIEIGSIKPGLVYYPGNRWRDGTDFPEVLTYNPETAYLAPDGKTIIPCHYDLIRANNLSCGVPGGRLYSVDELYKRVYVADVAESGLLTNPAPVAEQGDFCVVDADDKLFVCDDNVKIYTKDGKLTKIVKIPERPTTIGLDSAGEDIQYVTTRDTVYVLK